MAEAKDAVKSATKRRYSTILEWYQDKDQPVRE